MSISEKIYDIIECGDKMSFYEKFTFQKKQEAKAILQIFHAGWKHFQENETPFESC